MRYYTSTDSNVSPVRPLGSDAIERIIAERGAKAVRYVEGPDAIGCYLVTLDNGDVIDVSNTECTPHMSLNSRLAIKGWINAAIANAARVARDVATIRDENVDLVELAIAGIVRNADGTVCLDKAA